MNHLSVSEDLQDQTGDVTGAVAQSVERRRSNMKVVGSIPTLVRVFLCPCVGPVPSVWLTLTWFIWDKNLELHVTLHSLRLTLLSYYIHLIPKWPPFRYSFVFI